VKPLDPRVHAYRPDLADVELRGQVEAARFLHGSPRRIGVSHAPVRKAPSPEAPLLTEALQGEAVAVFDQVDGWAWVQLAADRYVGWVPDDSLSADLPAPTHRVAALRTFIFSAPDIKSPPLAALSLGAAVAATGEAEDRNARYALLAPHGAVVIQHLAPLDEREADWASVAEKFLGVPYLWGGKTSLGLDCSGLVQLAFGACGITAPRDSDMQERALGEALDFRGEVPDVRRGDLVFWPGHVGIMLDGEFLLHANAHHMAVAAEPLREARKRLASRGSEVSSVRRIRGG